MIIIIEKVLLGFTLAAPIGPVSIEMINRGLKLGFKEAFKVRLGGAIGNTCCLAISYLGLVNLINYPFIISTISILGAIYLMIIGIKNSLKQDSKILVKNDKIYSNALSTGFILALANPVSVIFWLSIFAATFDIQKIGLINFIEDLSIILGVLIWGVCLCSVISVGKTFLNKKIIPMITKIAGVFLFILGLKYMIFNIQHL
jgi:threonine/homoserine/homoserine lactone efflux protein